MLCNNVESTLKGVLLEYYMYQFMYNHVLGFFFLQILFRILSISQQSVHMTSFFIKGVYFNKEILVINIQKIIRGLLHTKIKFCQISFTSHQRRKKLKSGGGGLPNKKVSATIYIYDIHVYLPLCLCLSLFIMIRREKG